MYFEKFFKKDLEKNEEIQKKEKLKRMLEENVETRMNLQLQEPTYTELFGKWRSEYAKGETKLNFNHVYSSGVALNIKEDPKGLVSINFIDKEGKVLLEIENSLPPSYHFVAPSYIIERPDLLEKYISKLGVSSCLEENLILIGDIRSAKDLLIIFHEIGHINQERGAMTFHDFDKISKRERAAWAFAIKKVKEISKEIGVNIFEIFSNQEEVLKFIHAHLYEYRSSLGTVGTAMYGDEYAEEVDQLLKGYFDKGKFPKMFKN